VQADQLLVAAALMPFSYRVDQEFFQMRVHYFTGSRCRRCTVRGLAYLEQRKTSEAAAEFEKVLKHRGIVGYDPIGPFLAGGSAKPTLWR
jgi:hypothetical protein